MVGVSVGIYVETEIGMKVYYWTEYLSVLAVHIRISATMLQKLLHNSEISTGASQMQGSETILYNILRAGCEVH